MNSKLYYDGNGQPSSYMTVIININDRKQDEATKALLTRELAHRVRNTVQLTSSLARQTATTARSVKDYRPQVPPKAGRPERRAGHPV